MKNPFNLNNANCRTVQAYTNFLVVGFVTLFTFNATTQDNYLAYQKQCEAEAALAGTSIVYNDYYKKTVERPNQYCSMYPKEFGVKAELKESFGTYKKLKTWRFVGSYDHRTGDRDIKLSAQIQLMVLVILGTLTGCLGGIVIKEFNNSTK